MLIANPRDMLKFLKALDLSPRTEIIAVNALFMT